jgi:tartronate-semialdehyde synthase
MAQYKVPVVIEIVLEHVTNISMGTEIDNITEFEEPATNREDAPSGVGVLD